MPTTADAAANALYLAHAALELVLGMLKLRGRYQHETPGERPPRSAMYVRHHGFSLLALAYLGAVMWWRGLVNADVGGDVSVVLMLFHGGSIAAFLPAWAAGAIPTAKLVMPHAPFAFGFLWHVNHLGHDDHRSGLSALMSAPFR